MRPATRAVFLLLLVCVAILALTAKADEDPWADIVDEGEPAVARKGTWASDDAQKEAKKKDDKPASFLQRHGMVVMYVGVLLFNKLLRHFKGGNAEAGAAPGGNVKAVHNDAEWKALIDASKETKQLVIVDFSASWCGPCKMIAPEFERLSLKYPGTTFVKIDCDEVKGPPKTFNVTSYPTFVALRAGEKLGETSGADAARIEGLLLKHGAKEEPQLPPTDKGTDAGKKE